ncbi:hypothetical protein M0C34_04185 [Agarivorans sp. TSD2052]|uniref:hypothetical protein n=1 Tax=Agarivorans sp. TSD2052 TaxID=2937286 RepID=UPI0020103AF9|nr:hypothetical protein [Agarivorans sp. TSD2052]UPW19486.1 hypothetical protein M0C34_04185 [Agarivorans sp. TSD2052]
MGFNSKERNLQDQQASVLEETYRLAWMDGYGEGYDDGVEDTEAKQNSVENELELMRELLAQKDQVIDELATNAGRSLQVLKKR